MKNYRIFVEKYPEFQVEARSLLNELNENLQLSLHSLRLLNVYDLFGFTEDLLEKSRYGVFGEIVTDRVTDECDLSGVKYIAGRGIPAGTVRPEGSFSRGMRETDRAGSRCPDQKFEAHHS